MVKGCGAVMLSMILSSGFALAAPTPADDCSWTAYRLRRGVFASGRFQPLVVLAARVRGLWLIEEHLPHDPRRKRNEVWVLHERPEPAMRAGRQVCNSV